MKKNTGNEIAATNGKQAYKLTKHSDKNGEQEEEETVPKLVDTSKLAIVKSLLSINTFDELKDLVSEKTLSAIRDMNFTHMTEIQAKTIPHLLEGK